MTPIPALCRARTMSRNSRAVLPLPRMDAVARVGGEEAVGAVAPEVRQTGLPHLLRDVLFVEGHHRHQLDMGDAEVLEVGDLLHQAGEGPGVRDPGRGMAGEAAHMQLVDHHPLRRDGQGLIAAPVVVVGQDHGARRIMRAAPRRGCVPSGPTCSCSPPAPRGPPVRRWGRTASHAPRGS